MVNGQTPHLMQLAGLKGRDGTGGFGPFQPARMPLVVDPIPVPTPYHELDLNLTPGLSGGT